MFLPWYFAGCKYPGAAASLRERIEHTLAVQKLDLPAQLSRGLRTANAMEALTSQLRATVRRVSGFTTGPCVGRPSRPCEPRRASTAWLATFTCRCSFKPLGLRRPHGLSCSPC